LLLSTTLLRVDLEEIRNNECVVKLQSIESKDPPPHFLGVIKGPESTLHATIVTQV